MTLLISWIGADQKKEGKRVGSIYIAADSRYTWDIRNRFDSGVKVFGSTKFPEIFGFCGDVTFSSTVLSQLINQIDNSLIISAEDTSIDKNTKIFNYIKNSFANYPKKVLTEGFTIIHATRVNKNFFLFRTSGKPDSTITNFRIELPTVSNKIFSEGSGKTEFDNNFYKWENESHNNHRTSRAVYHCLNDTLAMIKDARTGGTPQIVGLYRIGNSLTFGILHKGVRYINGTESLDHSYLTNIEWRNELFERVDPISLELIQGAQRQPK